MADRVVHHVSSESLTKGFFEAQQDLQVVLAKIFQILGNKESFDVNEKFLSELQEKIKILRSTVENGLRDVELFLGARRSVGDEFKLLIDRLINVTNGQLQQTSQCETLAKNLNLADATLQNCSTELSKMVGMFARLDSAISSFAHVFEESLPEQETKEKLEKEALHFAREAVLFMHKTTARIHALGDNVTLIANASQARKMIYSAVGNELKSLKDELRYIREKVASIDEISEKTALLTVSAQLKGASEGELGAVIKEQQKTTEALRTFSEDVCLNVEVAVEKIVQIECKIELMSSENEPSTDSSVKLLSELDGSFLQLENSSQRTLDTLKKKIEFTGQSDTALTRFKTKEAEVGAVKVELARAVEAIGHSLSMAEEAVSKSVSSSKDVRETLESEKSALELEKVHFDGLRSRIETTVKMLADNGATLDMLRFQLELCEKELDLCRRQQNAQSKERENLDILFKDLSSQIEEMPRRGKISSGLSPVKNVS